MKKIIVDLSFQEDFLTALEKNNFLNKEEVIGVSSVFAKKTSIECYTLLNNCKVKHCIYGVEKALLSDEVIAYNGVYPNVVQAYETLLKDNDVEIICFGPLTNIATFLLASTKLKSKIQHIHIVSGSLFAGTQSITAEANAYADPEAMRIVLASDIPKTMYCLDSMYISSLNKRYEEVLNDVIQGKAITANRRYVDVDIQGNYTRGSILIDENYTLHKDANVDVIG